MKYASYGLILRLFGVFVICAHVVAGQSAVTYAMDEIGWAMLYQDSTTWRTRYSDLESGLTTDLAVWQNPAWVYRNEWYLFNSYDPNTWQQTYFYKKRSESEPAILFQWGWLNYFDAETGNFVYEAYDQATMSRKVYLSKIGQTEPTMVLDLPDTWISSWSPDMSKFVYSIYDPASWTSKLRLRKADWTEDVELGPMYRNEWNTSQYANYRFVGQNGVIVKTLNIYDNDTQTNAIAVSRISVTDFQNLVETPYGELWIWGNTYIVGYRGESAMTSTWNPDWTNTYRFVWWSLWWTEYVSGNSTWVISDYSSGKIGWFWDYFAFSGWDQATNQNVVELINVRTGEKTAVLRGGYVWANATYFESVPPCVGDYLTCWKPFSTTEEWRYVRRWGANGFIGYVWSFRTEQAPISKWIPGGFVWTANTNDWSDVTFANVWFFGSQLTEDWKNMFMANVGFAWTRGNMDWNDYFVAKSGYLWNAWTEDWNDVFITKSWYLWRERTWNFETEKKFAIGSFRSNWKGWVWNGKQNPQFEKPEGKDDNFLAYATEAPWETALTKIGNQLVHKIQRAIDQIDPVELSTGEFTYDNTVLRLAGAVMPFELSVKYRSRITYDGPLGWNWSHSYDQKLVADEYGRMTYVDGWLQNFTFETFDEGYQYLKWLEASLVKNADGTFEMAFKNWGKKNFNVNGMLTRVEDADGNGLDLAYDAQSRLTTVTDALWRPVTYSYGQNGRISKVSDPFWRSAYFEYFDGMVGTGSTNDLASITIDNWPEAKKTVSFTYSLGGADDTENHNLLTLTDSKGQEYVRNEYYPDDRVATQWFWDGSGRFQYETADVHSDDTPESVWTGPTIWTRVTKTVATNKRDVTTEYAFDRMGNVLSRTTYDLEWSGSARTAFEYDPVGRLLKETRPMGGWTVWKYDPNGNRTEERKKENASAPDNDLTDIVTTFEYDTGATDKLVTKSVAPDGTATRYEYDSKRRLVRTVTENVVLAAWSGGVDVVSTMEYDSLWRLFKTTDPAGRSTEFAYSGGLLVSTKKTWTWTGEILETVEYDAFWNPVKTTDGEGYASAAEYDAFWRVTLARSPGWLKKRSAYDANDNEVWTATEVQPHVWKNVRYSYDVLDKPVAVSEDVGDGRTATGTTAYDPNGNVAETTWPDGVRKTFSYDAQDRAVSWTETDGNLVRWRSAEYDRDGNLVKKTDANGNAWTYSYDGFGRAVSSVSPEGTETRVAYDKLGNAVRTVVLSGTWIAVSSSSAVFNALGKPLSVTAYEPMPDGSPKPDGAQRTAKTEYDADWSVAAAYDPEGNRTEYSYDGFGRLSAVRDPLGNETRTAYDRRGLVTKAESVGSDGKTVSVSKTYGPDGRLAETRESEGGVDLVTAFEYDGLGNVTGKTDAEGRTTSYSYDFRGLVLAETDAMGNTVTRSYDLAGRKVSQTDAEGRTTSYSYGKFGTPASETMPDGSAYSWTYDLNGNAVSSADPNGNSVTTAYDKENRPARKEVLAGSWILGGWTLEYSYDAAGRLVSATGTDGKTVAYSYDPFGGILSETSDGKAVTRTYGARGLETSLTLPSGRTVSRTYDAAWRTAGISALAGDGNGDPGTGTPQTLASYSYAGNFPSSVSYGNGVSENRSYGAFGRLASLSITKADSSEIRGWNYSYDKARNPLSDGTDAWAYDPLYRLKDVSYGLSGSGTGLPVPETFAHSANGNRTIRGFGNADGSSSGSASYYANQLDQYVTVEKSGNSGTGSEAYSYDLNGNLTETTRYRFAYDWANRLVRVTEKARTAFVWTGPERKEVWIGSETGTGEEVPSSEPPATEPPPAETPPADSGTSSGTENPPPDTGASSWAEVPPADGGASSWTETPPGTWSGTETGTWSDESGTGTETPPETGTWTEMPPESGTGPETWTWAESWSGTEAWSWTETGTGGTSSDSVETQSGSTASGTTESGSTVTEITYPERLVAEYSYDALWRRVSKALADRVVTYSYDGQKIVEETVTDLSWNVLRASEFAYWTSGDDDVLAEFRTESGATVTLYYLKDRLGSTAAVTDSSWSVLEEYRYSAFWSPYRKIADGSWEALGLETETLSGTVRPEPHTERLYTGREWDSETGLHHYRARTYSPELWRFLQRDPVGTADQMNPYAYVRNNPMMWTDPTGMFCVFTAGKEMAKGAAMGDLMENQNGWNVAWQVGLGFTPVWILGDARDFAYNMSKCSWWWCAWTAALWTAAFVPLLWDAAKYGIKAYKARKAEESVVRWLDRHKADIDQLVSKGWSKDFRMEAGEIYNLGRWKTGWISHTIVNKEIRSNMVRVDVEYPTGWSTWNVHVQIKWKGGPQKIFLDSMDDISNLPRTIKNDADIVTWIKKAFRNLNNFKP